jgi:hypothetical protein
MGLNHREAEEIPSEELEAASEVLDRLKAINEAVDKEKTVYIVESGDLDQTEFKEFDTYHAAYKWGIDNKGLYIYGETYRCVSRTHVGTFPLGREKLGLDKGA